MTTSETGGPVFRPGDRYEVQPRSLVLFIRHLEPEAGGAAAG